MHLIQALCGYLDDLRIPHSLANQDGATVIYIGNDGKELSVDNLCGIIKVFHEENELMLIDLTDKDIAHTTLHLADPTIKDAIDQWHQGLGDKALGFWMKYGVDRFL